MNIKETFPNSNKTANRKINKVSNKRGKRKNAKRVVKSLILAGFNPDGAKSKIPLHSYWLNWKFCNLING